MCVLLAAVLAPASASASRTLPRATAPDLERLPALELAGAAGADHAEPLPLYTFVDVVALDRVAGLDDDQVEAAVGRQRHRLHLVSSELARPGALVWGSKTATGVSTWPDADKHLEWIDLSKKLHRPSFQGLWTDPVSGLSYARNRWYDARSASWLSEDPMGAVDSVNLYAFVGWGPHMGTDPMGLADDWNYSMGGPKDPVVLAEKRRQAEEWCRAHPAECGAQNTRFAGGMMMAGSVLEGAGALGLCYTTGGLACAAGGSALLFHSFDTWETGRAMVRTGVPQETQTFRLFEQGYGTFLSPEHARTAARYTETLAPALIGAGMVRSALSGEARTSAATVRLNLADDSSFLPSSDGVFNGPGNANRVSQGVANNIKGSVFENVSDSASRRAGQFPFFRSQRRGGIDLALLDDGSVILREAKFANHLQFDDFTAITANLQSNMAEIRASLAGAEGLTRAERSLIGQALDDALAGRVPGNLRIQVQTGKATVGPRLQARIQGSTGGVPVEFVEHP